MYIKDGALSIVMIFYNTNFPHKRIYLRCCRDPRSIHAKGKNSRTVEQNTNNMLYVNVSIVSNKDELKSVTFKKDFII